MIFRLPLVLLAAVLASTLSGASTPPPASGPVLSRDEAIALALRRHQQIKVSTLDRGIARANVLAEYGRFDPALTFRRSYSESELSISPTLQVSQLTRNDEYALGLEGLTPWGLSYQLGGTANNQRGTFNHLTDNYVTFGGLTVAQPLLRGFGFGANLAALRIAKADRGIADWQFRQTVIDTVTGVLIAYDTLAVEREALQIARFSRDLAGQLVSDNEKRNRVGNISDADVIQARARLASREEGVIAAERRVKNAELELRRYLGETVFPAAGLELAIEPLAPAPPLTADGATDLRRAYDLRPDYQAARLGILQRRASHALARNDLLPRVDFVGSYGYNGVDREFSRSRAQVRDQDNRAYSAGVVVSVPLTFAEGRGRARAARLQVEKAQANLERLEQDIALAVAEAIGELDTTSRRVEATTRALELARQALTAEEKRFKAGATTTFFVLQLQEQLAAVQRQRVLAIGDQRRAVANYHRELGITLEAHGLKLD